MDKAIKKSAFPDEKKVKSYLNLIDEAAGHADKQLEKTVVTTPEACDHLLKSMDETETTVSKLLTEIKWPMLEEKPAAEEKPEDKAEEEKDGGKAQ
jgi:hypothetical protein